MTTQLITSFAQVQDSLRKYSEFVIDTETSSLYPHRDGKVLAGLAIKVLGKDESFYLPVRHDNSNNASIKTLIKVLNELKGKHLILFNAKFDLAVLLQEGVDLSNELITDALVAIRLVREDEPSYVLENLATRILKVKDAAAEKNRMRMLMRKNGWADKIINKDGKPDWIYHYEKIPADVILSYVDGDVVYTEGLYDYAIPLIEERNITDLLNIERRVTKVLFDMECRGFKINHDIVDENYHELTRRAEEQKQILYTFASRRMNNRWKRKKELTVKERMWLDEAKALMEDRPNKRWQVKSAADVKKVFHGLGVSSPIVTKKGNESWDKRVLNKIDHPMTQMVLDVRATLKVLDYYETLVELRTSENVIHCNINQAGAKTGRCSCREPNLQNIPRNDTASRMVTDVEDEEGTGFSEADALKVRDAYIAREGYFLLMADWSQVELRVLADYANEPVLLNAFQHGLDIHSVTARAAGGTRPSNADDAAAWRRRGKDTGFGIVYGIGKHKLGDALYPDLPRKEDETDAEYAKRRADKAARFIGRFFDRFPGIPRFIDSARAMVRKRASRQDNGLFQGWVANRYGRRRYLTVDYDEYKKDKSWLAPNFLIQGSSADFMKEKMWELHLLLKDSPINTLLVVHDEFIFEIPYKHNFEPEIKEIMRIMQTTERFKVPIVADLKYSTTSWAEAKSMTCQTCDGRGILYSLSDEEMFERLFNDELGHVDNHVCGTCGGDGYDVFKLHGIGV